MRQQRSRIGFASLIVTRACRLAVCLGIYGAQAAYGSPAIEPSEATKERARALFREGNAFLDEAHFGQALTRFERARALWDNPKIQLNIASTLRAMGREAAAANAYARYLDSTTSDSTHRAEVQAVLNELSLNCGRLVISRSDGVTQVLLDDAEVPALGAPATWVEPGRHVLVVRRGTEPPQVREFDIVAGEVRRIELGPVSAAPTSQLKPAMAAAPKKVDAARTGKLEEPESGAIADRAPERDEASGPAHPFGLSVRVDIDAIHRGGATAAGLTYAVSDYLRLAGGAVVGPHQGGWLGVECSPWRGALRPILGLSVPVFFVGSVYPGLSVEVGAGYQLSSRIAPFARVALAHFPGAPSGYANTLVVPAAGLEVKL